MSININSSGNIIHLMTDRYESLHTDNTVKHCLLTLKQTHCAWQQMDMYRNINLKKGPQEFSVWNHDPAVSHLVCSNELGLSEGFQGGNQCRKQYQ